MNAEKVGVTQIWWRWVGKDSQNRGRENGNKLCVVIFLVAMDEAGQTKECEGEQGSDIYI